MKKIKLATMVTGHFTVPPPSGTVYAPMDIMVDVSRGLVERGHEVTIFAPEGSDVPGVEVETIGLRPLEQEKEKIIESLSGQGADYSKILNLWDQILIASMFKGLEEEKFNIIHIHPIDRGLPLSLSHPNAPVFYTMHDPIDPWRASIYKMFQSPNQHYVSISNAQRSPAPELNYASTVYNGINTKKFAFQDKPEDYFIFVGRLEEKKGVAEAVQSAKKAEKKLIIIGPTPKDKDQYWSKKVEPYLDDKNIKYAGFVSIEEKIKLLQGAKAILVPIKWEEPFGLVMTEAMSCGTPVIAFNRGSVPEIVEDGENGFIVDDVSQMVSAMDKIDSIDRAKCRKSVEEKFSIEKMVDGYEEAFLKLI